MEPNQAAEHLQTIRTLMERTALYRRALAPIMIYCGVVGIIGAIIGKLIVLVSMREFALFWMAMAVVAMAGAFLLVRRQALKDSEPFWSPPTRRVVQALMPPFTVGFLLALWLAYHGGDGNGCILVVFLWCLLFGLGINSAGFFMPRGLKLFGWIFIFIGCGSLFWLVSGPGYPNSVYPFLPNWLMGGIFGGLHLAYGIYLYFTEKGGNAS